VQIISTATSGTFIFEGSNSTSSATFQAIPVFRIDSASPNAIVTAITPASSNFIYIFPVRYRYIRVRIATVLNIAVQAITRLSQDPFVAPVVNVINATAGNLNGTMSIAAGQTLGTVTSVGTVTTVSTVSAVTNVTSASLSQVVSTDLTAVAVSTSGVSATITPVNAQSASFALVVTVTSGSGTLDVVLQEALDGNPTPTKWENIYSFERLTTATRIYSPAIRLAGSNIRLTYVVTGTVQYAVTLIRTTRQAGAPTVRRLIDTVLNPNNTTTPSQSLWVDGCEALDMVVSMNAGGTAPVIQLNGSEDAVNFYNIGATVTATVGATTSLGIADGSLPKYIRAETTVAGVGSSLNYVCLKGKSAG
jgi:hypothetical protein